MNGKTYPGNTMLRHCDEEADPFDPALDLFEIERIEIYPEVPIMVIVHEIPLPRVHVDMADYLASSVDTT